MVKGCQWWEVWGYFQDKLYKNTYKTSHYCSTLTINFFCPINSWSAYHLHKPPGWKYCAWSKTIKFGMARERPATNCILIRWTDYKDYKEGVNGVNRLATKGWKYYWLPTKRVKNYRLPTGKILTDYRHGLTLSIFVSEKKSILHFFPAVRK